MKTLCPIVVVVLSTFCSKSFGGAFENLGFDDLVTNNISPDQVFATYFSGFGSATELLPHWQLYKGTVLVTELDYNNIPLGGEFASVIGKEATIEDPRHFDFMVEGKAAIRLNYSSEAYRLVQAGEIPQGARFLEYSYKFDPFEVSVNGITLRPTRPDLGGISFERRTVDFDISAFSGQTVELSLKVLGLLPFAQGGSAYLDSITFVVPEPPTLAILSLAAGMLFCYVRKKHR